MGNISNQDSKVRLLVTKFRIGLYYGGSSCDVIFRKVCAQTKYKSGYKTVSFCEELTDCVGSIPQAPRENLLGDLNARVGIEDTVLSTFLWVILRRMDFMC